VNRCLACDSTDLLSFLSLHDMPVSVGMSYSSKAAARGCARGDIDLALCHQCGLISNCSFDAARVEYVDDYDNALDYSSVFQLFARELAERLIARNDLHGKNIVDVGCGKGSFLKLICELGNNRGVGFDPTCAVREADGPNGAVRFVRDVYGPRHSRIPVDAVLCRQVLEHIDTPTQFLRGIRETIRPRNNVVVYFEVPNTSTLLHDLDVWTVVYEHCCYYTTASLRNLFLSCAFAVCDVFECFDKQFLGIEARPGDDPARHDAKTAWAEVAALRQAVESFADKYSAKGASWRRRLTDIERSGSRVVAWGAGARTISLFNALGIEDQVPYLVDINPHKQGKFLAGTGQEIVGPEFLRAYRPEVVVVMNSIYQKEIEVHIEHLGLHPQYVAA